jgi:predicted proteasome-type protease
MEEDKQHKLAVRAVVLHLITQQAQQEQAVKVLQVVTMYQVALALAVVALAVQHQETQQE